MLVIPLLEVTREPFAAKLRVQRLDAGEDPRQQRLETEAARHLQRCRCDGVEGGGGARVRRVDADAEDDLVGTLGVGAVGEDAADFDVGGVLGG